MLPKAQIWSGSLPILASGASAASIQGAWIQGAFTQAGWAARLACAPGLVLAPVAGLEVAGVLLRLQ